MSEFDFALWVSRARAFTRGLRRVAGATIRSEDASSPATDSDVRIVEGELGVALPALLRKFLTEGSAALNCSYAFEPGGDACEALEMVLPDQARLFGGARLGPLSELAENARAVRDWAADTWVADVPDQRSLWEAAIPFLRLDNGDYLALDPQTNASNPPVAYLCHDDDSFLIAAGFQDFLTAWEQLCYLGPEEWLLRPFIGEAGYLDGHSERAARLQRLLGQ
jgi:hypothetical protein